MKGLLDSDESRRQFLLQLLSAGAFTSLAGCTTNGSGIQDPTKMPAGRSIFEFSGDVTINKVAATLTSPIGPGDVVATGEASYVIFVVNKDAFILRSSSQMTLPADTTANAFDLNKGKALSVLATRKTRIQTPTAVIGVRGTGVYLEVEPDQSYVCTCYGGTDLAAADDPAINETIIAQHHDAPRYILGPGTTSGSRIQPAPFINHDDEELLLIETLVGRTTPYVVPRGISRSRRSYF